jgi:NTE family protein
MPLNADAQPPVTGVEAGTIEDGIAVCLSGGGYRAMLFHLGSLWRLNEAGLLRRLDRVSSVSGGSITAGQLGAAWDTLDFDSRDVARAFVSAVVEPIRTLARRTVDQSSIWGGLVLPGSVAEQVAAAYAKHLFGRLTLQDLPSTPRFVINATNVQTGALWRFSKPYMGDYLVGRIMNPTVSLASAVAASSAFPPVLSPLKLDLAEDHFAPPGPGEEPPMLGTPEFRDHVVLTDGGVYDNLGLETAWKRYRTILVSDGGGKLQADAEPATDWARHALRINEIIDNQVRSLRKRQTIDAFRRGDRLGTYWGIRTDIADYGLADAYTIPHEQSMQLANLRTRLKAVDDDTQERVISWGFAVCDTALRAHYDPALPRPPLPYPVSGWDVRAPAGV